MCGGYITRSSAAKKKKIKAVLGSGRSLEGVRKHGNSRAERAAGHEARKLKGVFQG